MKVIRDFIELEKQKKEIWCGMKQKREAISDEVYDVQFETTSACIHKMDVFGIGTGWSFTQIEFAYCDNFDEHAYCPYRHCFMNRKNHRYINSVQLYDSVKQAQKDLIKDTLKTKNK